MLKPPAFAILGASFDLTCTADIDDRATVEQFRWYHNQTEITSDEQRFNIRESARGSVNSILSVASSKRQDGGEYHCQAFISGSTNPVNSTSHTIKIQGIIS
jgi:hypothetical protein